MKITKKVVTLSGGLEVAVFSISHLSSALRRTNRMLWIWEKELGFPSPILDLGDGHRWYTADEIAAYARIADRVGIGGRVERSSPFFAECRKKYLELRTAFAAKIKEAEHAQASS